MPPFHQCYSVLSLIKIRRANGEKENEPQRSRTIKRHAWFEKIGPECTITLFVDNVTSQITTGQFVPAETTEAYQQILQSISITMGGLDRYMSISIVSFERIEKTSLGKEKLIL